MAEPARTSPLADLARSERSWPVRPRSRSRELPFGGKLILRGGDAVRRGRPRRSAAPCPSPSAAPPARARERSGSARTNGCCWRRAGPSATAAALRAALAGLHHAVVVVSDRFDGHRRRRAALPRRPGRRLPARPASPGLRAGHRRPHAPRQGGGDATVRRHDPLRAPRGWLVRTLRLAVPRERRPRVRLQRRGVSARARPIRPTVRGYGPAARASERAHRTWTRAS